MATLIENKSDKTGKIAGYTIQWYEGQQRRTISLSGRRYSKQTAERLKEIVEKLRYYRQNDLIPDRVTEHWLQATSDEIRSKLAKVGLLTLVEPVTYQKLWDLFFENRTDLKPTSLSLYHYAQKCFFKWFLPTDMADDLFRYSLIYGKNSSNFVSKGE